MIAGSNSVSSLLTSTFFSITAVYVEANVPWEAALAKVLSLLKLCLVAFPDIGGLTPDFWVDSVYVFSFSACFCNSF